ncbi:MAG TPA: hypothetical protein VEF76_07740 [Patescibacteria group bacterium]|nr:hypothetical protein [Patescibacteria group bacterium]
MASRLRKGLTAIFLAATLGGGVAVMTAQLPPNDSQAVAASMAQPQSAPEAPYVYSGQIAPYESRALTAGEARLAQNLFGDQLDVSAVRLHFFSEARKSGVADVAGQSRRDIEVYGRANASADFSGEAGDKYGAFVFELTELWQNQTGGKLTLGEPAESGYPLDEDFAFKDYGQLQQPQIMEDYARRFLHPDRKSHWLAQQSGDNSESDPLLQALVENQFPAAKNARLAFANVDVQPLTAGEAALLKGIFGDTIDTAVIRKNFHPQDYKDIVGSINSSKYADFWGAAQKSADFSVEKDPDVFGTFVHELAHVWQNQTDSQYTRADYPMLTKDKYRYALGKPFTAYTSEQQAAIIEDYARRFLHPTRSWTYLDGIVKDAAAMDAQLQKVVEDQFPGAKTFRETYERTHPAKAPVPVAGARSAAPGRS